MATSLFEVVLTSNLHGVDQIARWNYVGSGTPAAVSMSFALSKAFGIDSTLGVFTEADSVLKRLQDLLSSDVRFMALAVKDVYSVTDFYETPFAANYGGTLTGDTLHRRYAYGWTTNRVRADIGRGHKRISGVNESVVGDAGAIDTSAGTAIALAAVAMSQTLTYDDEGSILTFIPCVVRREKVSISPPDIGVLERFSYRYYETYAEQSAWLASGVTWFADAETTTQNSRED